MNSVLHAVYQHLQQVYLVLICLLSARRSCCLKLSNWHQTGDIQVMTHDACHRHPVTVVCCRNQDLTSDGVDLPAQGAADIAVSLQSCNRCCYGYKGRPTQPEKT